MARTTVSLAVALAAGLLPGSVAAAAAGPDLRLVGAAAGQDRAAVRALIQEGVDVDAARADGATALLWAAHWNDREMVELLLDAGADVNAAEDHGVTPLARACENASADVVERLLAAGAEPNAAQTNGLTPLMIAARTGDVDVVRALLAAGADSPRGAWLGTVRIPEMAANLHWGGSEWRTLFVCATTSVYAVETKVGPHVEPFMRRAGDDRRRALRGLRTRAASSGTRAAPAVAPWTGSASTTAASRSGGATLRSGFTLDPARSALIVQDMQNDVMAEGGAFAESGSPRHAREQNVVENIRRLAEHCRSRGVIVVHVHFEVEPGAPGLTLNAPLFEGLADANALVRGTWGAAPVEGLEPKPGDHVVTKMRMSAWEGSSLETVLKSGGRDTLIDTGAWTNMSIEHTARTGADKGYFMVVPEDACSTVNAEWHAMSIGYALQNVAIVTRTDDVIAALGS